MSCSPVRTVITVIIHFIVFLILISQFTYNYLRADNSLRIAVIMGRVGGGVVYSDIHVLPDEQNIDL